MTDRIWTYPPTGADVPLILADILGVLETLNSTMQDVVALELKRIRLGIAAVANMDLEDDPNA